jgi:hypothetical protein
VVKVASVLGGGVDEEKGLPTDERSFVAVR